MIADWMNKRIFIVGKLIRILPVKLCFHPPYLYICILSFLFKLLIKCCFVIHTKKKYSLLRLDKQKVEINGISLHRFLSRVTGRTHAVMFFKIQNYKIQAKLINARQFSLIFLFSPKKWKHMHKHAAFLLRWA